MELREAIIRGAGHLMLRQVLGVLLSLAGVTLLARWVGPGPYGTYAAAYALFVYVAAVTQSGISTYLVRLERDVTAADYDYAFTLLCVLAFFGTIASIIIAYAATA